MDNDDDDDASRDMSRLRYDQLFDGDREFCALLESGSL